MTVPSATQSGRSSRGSIRPIIIYDLVASLIFSFGDLVVGIALPFYVYDLTHSVLATGAMFIASTLPGLVVGSVAGVFVDRGDRKRTMVVADLTRVALMLLLLAVRSRDTGWIVYLVAFVEARQLTAANALSSVGGNVVNIVGPTVGGALVVMGGLPGVVLVDSVSFERANRWRGVGGDGRPARRRARGQRFFRAGQPLAGRWW